MIKYLFFLLSLVILAGCGSSQVQEQPSSQPTPEAQKQAMEEPSFAKQDQPKSGMKGEEKEIGGSAVSGALNTMNNASEQMVDTIKMMQTLQAGEQVLECQDQQSRTKAFKMLQTFFGKNIFDFDQDLFWFYTANGGKAGLSKEDGLVDQCTVGMFASFKRVIVTQFNTRQTVRTEFYVDTQPGDLMVHRFRGMQKSNENYKLGSR